MAYLTGTGRKPLNNRVRVQIAVSRARSLLAYPLDMWLRHNVRFAHMSLRRNSCYSFSRHSLRGSLRSGLLAAVIQRFRKVESVDTMSQPMQKGFTLIELLVVMAIISMLLTIAVPKYFSRVELSKEKILQENLAITRQALDNYYGDNGKYPATLEDLITKKYLRSLPSDPVTGSTSTWVLVPPENPDSGGVYDIRSGAPGNGQDGTPFKDW